MVKYFPATSFNTLGRREWHNAKNFILYVWARICVLGVLSLIFGGLQYIQQVHSEVVTNSPLLSAPVVSHGLWQLCNGPVPAFQDMQRIIDIIVDNTFLYGLAFSMD